MAHVLQISTDTDTVVTFTSGSLYLADYVPSISFNGEDVRETARVGFTGSLSTIRANVQSINKLFEQARNYNTTRTGKKVYLEFDPDTSGTLYRALVKNGRVNMTDRVLGNQWGASNLELEIEWTRVGYWEGALTQIALTNGSDTDNTSGITVNNRDDSTGDNWVSIAAASVTGDLPAPIKVQMYNATTDANATDEIYIFHNVYSNPATMVHVYEGESAVASTDIVATTDTTSSALSHAAITWATTDEHMIAEFTIPSTDLSDHAGGRFAVLARWYDVSHYTDMWLRLRLETSTTYNDLWVGNLALLSTTTDTRELTMLDTLRLPPYLENQTNLRALALRLYGLRGTTDTHALNLDYIMLGAISGDDGWKRFKSVDRGIPAEETFIHDDTEGFTYHVDASSNKIAEFTSYGGPIMLIPGAVQKLYFVTCDYLGISSTTQNWTVKLWYRPRRNAL